MLTCNTDIIPTGRNRHAVDGCHSLMPVTIGWLAGTEQVRSNMHIDCPFICLPEITVSAPCIV